VKPVFANSAWIAARESLILKGGKGPVDLAVRYGLVLHPRAGPVLIDTGYTPHALTGERPLGLRLYGHVLRPRLIKAMQPAAFLARFGLTPQDITQVIVTHFHADHVSGLTLFPKARFIADDTAWARVKARSAWQNLRHGVFPSLLPQDFGNRLVALTGKPQMPSPGGLPPGHDLFGDGSMLAIGLPGHADGHFGVLFPKLERPLLYAVDAQWLLPALAPGRSPGYPSRLIAEDAQALDRSTTLVGGFQASGDVVLCHDPSPTPFDLRAAE